MKRNPNRNIFGGKSPTFADTVDQIMGPEIGQIVVRLSDALDNSEMDKAKLAMSFIMAFIIDTYPDKREAYNEVMEILNKMISFDRPAFRGIPVDEDNILQ